MTDSTQNQTDSETTRYGKLIAGTCGKMYRTRYPVFCSAGAFSGPLRPIARPMVTVSHEDRGA